MATSSFTKSFVIENPKAVEKFINIISDEKPKRPINKELTSDENMERGRESLKQYLSESSS